MTHVSTNGNDGDKKPPSTKSDKGDSPNEGGPSAFRPVWLRYVTKTSSLLTPVPSDRPLDQFIQYRYKVYEIITSDRFLSEADGAWRPLEKEDMKTIGSALLAEMEAFSNAVEVAEQIEPPEKKASVWGKGLLEKASVVTGSVADILDHLPPYAKHGITLFKELVDLFKAKI